MDTETDISNARIKSTKELLIAFFILADDWVLSLDEQITLLGEKALLSLAGRLESDAEIIVDDQTIARLVLLDSICKKINEITPIVEADSFLRTSSKRLGGKTPLSVILEDPDAGLPEVTKHLMLMSTSAAAPVYS